MQFSLYINFIYLFVEILDTMTFANPYGTKSHSIISVIMFSTIGVVKMNMNFIYLDFKINSSVLLLWRC